MNKSKEAFGRIVGYILPWFVLSILLFYTYIRFFEYPYLGFRLDAAGRVTEIYAKNISGQSLQPGDRLIQMDSLRWDDFRKDLRQPLIAVHPGQVLSLKIERNTQVEDISWVLPGPTSDEIISLVVNQSWLAYVFWFVGSLTLFTMRPKDERWRLMIGFNYLTAIFVITGGIVSLYHLGESAIILHMTVWICVPVYLHLNWVFPKSLVKRPWQLVWGSYIVAIAFAMAEYFQALPLSLYYSGFLLAIAGSIIFLIIHAILQPEVRRDLRFLMIASLLALVLPAIFGVLSALNITSALSGGIAVLSLPFLPLGYFYASYRRQLGDLEVRVNRFISGYLFSIAAAVIFLVCITIADIIIAKIVGNVDISGVTISVGLIVAILSTGLSIWLFPAFQSLVERRLLGIRLAPAQLQEIYSARITTSTSLSTLQVLITDDILPSLLVREFMFLQFDDDLSSSNIFFAVGVPEDQAPPNADIPELITNAGNYRPLALLQGDQPSRWIRLVLPLKIGTKLTGLWLFGRRDPDDIYSQIEIPTLQSLANQMAIVQSNILQTDRLKSLYLINIARDEEERLNLARELHDSVLNQIVALTMTFDSPLPPGFQANYEKLTQEVREIVSNLRPVMLSYGLKLAIEELVENLLESSKNAVNITLEIMANNGRYPQNIEQHVFRIIQESCSNAIRHASAKNIHISGRLDIDEISLKVEDDGMGFQVGENLDNLLANKHFGLAGMRERAELIGADFRIRSTSKSGTCITIQWENRATNV